jgi:hypothetical protein
MGLDIRWPIGFIFTIYGVILLAFGLKVRPEIFAHSLGLNIDLWWGGAMLAFGLLMAGLAFKASRRNRM